MKDQETHNLRITFIPFRGGFYSHTSHMGGHRHRIDNEELEALIQFGSLPQMNKRQKELFLGNER